MNDFLKDHIFVGAISVAVLSGTMLTGKQILPRILNSGAQPAAAKQAVVRPVEKAQVRIQLKHLPAAAVPQVIPPVQVDEQQVMEEELEKVVANDAAINSAPAKDQQILQAPVDRTPASIPNASLPSTTRSMPVLKKVRPKQGGNEWLVGKSSAADSSDLESILKNADSGDVVIVESGSHNFGFFMVGVPNLEIRGTKDTKLVFKEHFSLPKFKELKLSDLEIVFPDVTRNFISVGGARTKFVFNKVKMALTKFTLNFRDDVEVLISDSEFSGVTLRFSNDSRAIIKETYMEKAKNLISLSNNAQLEITHSRFYNFENVAVTSDSNTTVLKASNMKVAHGMYAFWGTFHSENTQIKDSSFSDLKEFTLSGTVVKCSVCEKFNIER